MLKNLLIVMVMLFFYGNFENPVYSAERKVFFFYADWCAPCQLTKKHVMYHPNVVKEMKKYDGAHFVNIDEVDRNVLNSWKNNGHLQTIPELAITEKLEDGKVKVLAKWKPTSLNTIRGRLQSRKSLIALLQKYSPKKPQENP